MRGDENTEGNILKKCEESLCLIWQFGVVLPLRLSSGYSWFGFKFAGSVALSSEGRFKVAKILINFQLIINCYFNEAFPFVIIYKINFDIWKLNFLSNFGTDRPLYCTLIGKGPKDSSEPKIKNTLSCWYWGSGSKQHLSTHTAGLVDCIDWCIRFSQEQAGF